MKTQQNEIDKLEKELNSKRKQLSLELEDVEKRVDAATQKELEKVELDINKKKGFVKELNETIELLENNKDSLQENLETLIQQTASYKGEVIKLKEEVTQNQSEFDILSNQKQSLENEIIELQKTKIKIDNVVVSEPVKSNKLTTRDQNCQTENSKPEVQEDQTTIEELKEHILNLEKKIEAGTEELEHHQFSKRKIDEDNSKLESDVSVKSSPDFKVNETEKLSLDDLQQPPKTDKVTC